MCNLSSTLRVTYANRVVHANVNVNDDTRTNRDETRVRRDATRVVANVNNVDARRDTTHVASSRIAMIDALRDMRDDAHDAHDDDTIEIDAFDNDDDIDAFIARYATNAS